jgi:hypothetical protein
MASNHAMCSSARANALQSSPSGRGRAGAERAERGGRSVARLATGPTDGWCEVLECLARGAFRCGLKERARLVAAFLHAVAPRVQVSQGELSSDATLPHRSPEEICGDAVSRAIPLA